MKPKLQVALDLMNLNRTIPIAKAAIEGGVDWLEAGTPLIKSEGMDSIRKLREVFPDITIVADMKTMDVGGLEVEMAAKAGADIVSILANADDETFKEAILSARNYDAKIMADLIRIENPQERTRELCNLGVDYICVHVGVDAQMRGEDPLDILDKVVEASTVPVAVAGGITSENSAKFLEHGADIIIVGGAITKAKDVATATRDIKKAMDTGTSIKSQVFGKQDKTKIREIFEKVSTANISDAMHREPCMQEIVPMTVTGGKMVGTAYTVRTVDGDWAKPVEAIEAAKKGDVIVVDAGGGTTAVWGELASWSCKTKGIRGIVIDGAARDIDEIRDIEFPVFAKHRSSNAGEPKGYGGTQIDIKCGQRAVKPGDWIIGDDSGVMVVPEKEALMIANRALDVMDKENRVREEIKEGKTLSVVMELEKWEKKG